MLDPDLADGDDLVFFNKYGDQEGEEDVDDDSFDNGYYF